MNNYFFEHSKNVQHPDLKCTSLEGIVCSTVCQRNEKWSECVFTVYPLYACAYMHTGCLIGLKIRNWIMNIDQSALTNRYRKNFNTWTISIRMTVEYENNQYNWTVCILINVLWHIFITKTEIFYYQNSYFNLCLFFCSFSLYFCAYTCWI